MKKGNIARRFLLVLALLCAAGLPTNARAKHEISSEIRTGVREAVLTFIDLRRMDGIVRFYDPVENKLLRLKFEALHDEVEHKGDFLVTCGDFRDQSGRKIDLDFLVLQDGGDSVVAQTVVHAIDGAKREYNLGAP